MRSRPLAVRVAVAAYRALVWVVPGRLGRTRGRAMVSLFDRLAREAHRSGGVPATFAVWWRSVLDLLWTTPAHHLARWRSGRSRARQRTEGRSASPSSGRRPGGRVGTNRNGRGWIMGDAAGELRQAARSLVKRPTVVTVTALTMALGIGATTAVFSVVWGSWLKPLPFPDADRLVLLSDRHESFPPGRGGSTINLATYLDQKEGATLFESMAAFSPAGTTLSTDEGYEQRHAATVVEPGFFDVLDARMALGRTFTPDDRAASENLMVISHGLWLDAFEGASDVLGARVYLGSSAWTIVGVLSPDFQFKDEPDIFVPLSWSPEQAGSYGGRSIRALGRLKEGVELETARAELQRIYAGVAEEHPAGMDGWTAWLGPLKSYVVGNEHDALLLMSVAVVLLLLITCVNVASILVARGESRQREMAVRAAMGASRGRMLGTFVNEGLLLGVLGGLLGVVVAYFGIDLLVSIFGDDLRRPSEIGLNRTTLVVAVGVTFLTSVAVSMVPALRQDPARVGRALRDGGRGASRGGNALRRALVVSEIVLAVVLASGAGLLVNTVWRLTRADLGFEPGGAAVVSLQLPEDRYDERGAQGRLFRTILGELQRRPDVMAAGATDSPPPDARISRNGAMAVGRQETTVDFVLTRYVTPGLFEALEVSLVSGTTFGWEEPTDDARELPVVISEPLADALFPERRAVGERITFPDAEPTFRVVGVAEAVHQQGATEPPSPTVYFPWPALASEFVSRPTLVVRSAEAEESTAETVRAVLARTDADIRFTTRSLTENLDFLYRDQEFTSALLGIFALLALLLGAIGVYGVMAFTVARRTREVGVRLALGADRSAVVGMVMRQGVALTAVGLAVGIAAATGLSRFISGLLYGVSPLDPLTFGMVTLLFLTTAVAACYVPARRAAAIEPSEALRGE